METHIRVNSKMVNFMDKVNLHVKVVVLIKVNLWMVIAMVNMKKPPEEEKSAFRNTIIWINLAIKNIFF